MPHEMSRDFSHPASFHVILSASVAPHWQTRATQWRGWPKHTTLTICVIMSNLEGNPKIWNTWAQPPCSRGVGDPLEIHLSSHVFPAESNGTSVINEIHLKNTLIPCVLPFKVTHMVTWTRPCTGIQRSHGWTWIYASDHAHWLSLDFSTVYLLTSAVVATVIRQHDDH